MFRRSSECNNHRLLRRVCLPTKLRLMRLLISFKGLILAELLPEICILMLFLHLHLPLES